MWVKTKSGLLRCPQNGDYSKLIWQYIALTLDHKKGFFRREHCSGSNMKVRFYKKDHSASPIVIGGHGY